MPVMAISICKILCVPMVTSIGFKWERLFLYLVYILAGLTAWLVGVCWSIFFLRKQSVVNNWFISFLSSLIVCTFPQNESHVGLLPTATWPWTSGGSALSTSPQAQHWLWNPGSPWPGKLFSGLSNLKIENHNPPFPRPWEVETWTSSGLCSRAPCLPPQSTFGTDFCSSQMDWRNF